MALQHDNQAFWQSQRCHIAVSPHRPQDAEGLADFAATSVATRSLLFFQTSGSEGVPKCVGLSREAFLASARAVNAHLESTAQDRWLIALPLHHVGGFSILARCHESGASFSQMQEKWDARRFASLCMKEGITLTSLVPAQVFDIVQANLEAPTTLRAIVVGGGSLAKDIGQRAIALGWPVMQSFGMTEACSQIATEPLGHAGGGFDPDWLEVLPCWNLETAENGSLTLRGEPLAAGYAVKRDGAWRWEAIDAARGLVTRDRVEIASHGTRRFLRFLGREASFVKVLGELVNVAALQARLEGLAVALGMEPYSVAVLPLPDDRKETRLVLAGESGQDVLEGLRAEFNAASSRHEHLESSHSVASLPRTGLGKLDVPAACRLVALAPGDAPFQ